MLYRCNLCVHFTCETLRLLIRHLARVHKNDPGFHVVCGIDECPRTYTNFFSLRNHFQRKHGDLLRQESENLPTAIQGDDDDIHEATTDDDSDQNDDNDQQHQAPAEFNLAEEAHRNTRCNALCLLQIKDEGKIPQTVVESIAKNATTIVDNNVDLVRSGVESCLQNAGLQMHDIPGLEDIFDSESPARKPFEGCNNEASQTQYYKRNFNLVEPQKIVLGRYHKKVRKGHKLVDVQREDKAYYVPMLESIQQLLNNEAVLEEIEHPHSRDDGLLGDYCDGEDFKSHPLFSSDPHALQILLFFDELEVCNPLGSRANKHKIGNFYYTLGNISPDKRATLNAIQLVAIVTSKHLKQYGIDTILDVIMNDIRQLEQDIGVTFIINGQQRAFRGTIAYCSGDNLGLQLLGGFKEGSQAHRKCRECMGLAEQIQTQFHECEFTQRTKDGYEVQCRRIADNDYFSVTYGINRRSVLNESRYFHVVGGLPADAMHDILEGVLQYHTKELLKLFILEEKVFTLEEVNKRIASFDYGYHNDSNKPSPILRTKLLANDNSLKQHANQMWCLGLFLPLLIGEFISEDNEHWEAYCILLQIIRIVFSPVISKEQMPYLQVLIQNHHERFKELYPNASIIPKMHYMTHMPRIILRLGPLSRIWCMRYEAKHSYFKKLAVSSGNFINLPYTLAKRHQEGVCYRTNTPEGSNSTFLQKANEIGPGTIRHAGNTDEFQLIRESYNLLDITPETPVFV